MSFEDPHTPRLPIYDAPGMTPEPMVPRRPHLDLAAHQMAEKLPPRGGWVITGQRERVEAISNAIIYARGAVFASTVDIAVAPSEEAEIAFLNEIRAGGDDRPISYDPVLLAQRAAEKGLARTPPATCKPPRAKAARPVDPERRAHKAARLAARRERRNAQHQALLAMIDTIPSLGGIVVVQDTRVIKHVFDTIAQARPELIRPGFIVIIAAPTVADEEREIKGLPTLFRRELNVFHTPGLALYRERAERRARIEAARIQAENAAEAERVAEAAAAEVAAAARARWETWAKQTGYPPRRSSPPRARFFDRLIQPLRRAINAR